MVDKPAGPTSHDIVATVRKALGTRRVGHTGTLDPFATGLLVVLVGRATRLAQFLTGLDKEYEGVLRLGARSDTNDRTGTITVTNDAWQRLSDTVIAEAMTGLCGWSRQQPPMYSAKKVGGERAHRIARRGGTIELESRDVRVDRFQLRGRRGSDIEFEAAVSTGTYVRALARDLGQVLGCDAYVEALRRTRVGGFRLEDADDLQDVVEGRATMLPPAVGVRHLPAIEVDAETQQRVAHGRAVEGGQDGEPLVALMAGPDLIAVAERQGRVLKPRVVLSG